MVSTYLGILHYPEVWVVEIFALAYLGWEIIVFSRQLSVFKNRRARIQPLKTDH